MTNADAQLLKGKVVIITGATRGIGLVIANLFAEYGASMISHLMTGDDSYGK